MNSQPQGDRARTEKKKSGKGLYRFFSHTPVAVGGIVAFSILGGVLFFVQAGFLLNVRPSNETPKSNLTSASSDDSKRNVKPTDSKPLQPETPVRQEQTKAATRTQAGKPSEHSGTCKSQDKAFARSRYDTSMKSENKLHSDRLSRINKNSQWLSRLSLGIIRDKAAAENSRHEKALKSIESDYQQRLARAGCK